MVKSISACVARHRSVGRTCATVAGMALCAAAHAQDVAVVGGQVNNVPFKYAWTVTNHTNQRIVSFEVPHYYGLTWQVPDAWDVEITEKANYNEKKKIGRFHVYTTEDHGIRTGETVSFALDLAPIGERRGLSRQTGTAIIGFADGSTIRIEEIDVPGVPSTFERTATPIFLGGVVAILLAGKLIRDRRKRRKTADVGAPTG